MGRLLVLVGLVSLVAAACRGGGDDGTTATTVRSPEQVARILDGATPVDAELEQELGELARDRAVLGARWLAGTVRDDGRYHYWYRAVAGEFDDTDYNEVRHAGVTYALYQAYGETGDETLLEAAEQASEWIDAQSIEADVGRRYDFGGRTKLGGQALALVALLERRRVTDDPRFDGLIDDLAAFILSMEREDPPGRYWMSYDAGERLPTPDSLFYPGETLLALTRLARAFPDEAEFLEAAERAAAYLVHVRDGDIPELGEVPRDDHWLTIALAELYRLDPEDGYAAVVDLQGLRMRGFQYTEADGHPGLIGANKLRDPVNYTSTATKGEALVAAWSLALHRGRDELAAAFAEAARRTAQFAMRIQYTAGTANRLPDPHEAIGAWPQDPTVPDVRMDFVQHNVSLLLGTWWMTDDGDVPQAVDPPTPETNTGSSAPNAPIGRR